MRMLDLLAQIRRRKPYTHYKQAVHKYPNLLNRNFEQGTPNKFWVTDITYIPVGGQMLYMCAVLDLCGKQVLAYRIGTDMTASLVTDTVRDALQKEKVTNGLALHSDQGSQYTSQAYFDLSQSYHFSPSMSSPGCPYDNAAMENFFGTLKVECLYRVKFSTRMEAENLIAEYVLQGSEDHRMHLPSVIGHECSGTVWHIGKNVKSVKPGDRVTVWPAKACKECFACKEGFGHVCQHLQVRGIETEGAFQYAWTVDEEALVRLPDTVSMLHGALVEPLAICCHVVKRGQVKDGDFVVVIGGGPIGIMTALVAKAAGADVLLSEVNEMRLEKAREMGIETVNPLKENLQEAVKKMTDGKRADVVFETSGSQPGVDSMVYLPKVHGTVVLVAIYGKPMTVDLKQLYYYEKNVVTARMQEKEDMEKAIALLAERKIDADKIITSVLPLKDIQEGFDRCMDRNGNEVKVMIQCDDE